MPVPAKTNTESVASDCRRASDLLGQLVTFLGSLHSNTAESFRVRCQFESECLEDAAVQLRRDEVTDDD